jgi:hypothetical protein
VADLCFNEMDLYNGLATDVKGDPLHCGHYQTTTFIVEVAMRADYC